MLSPHDRKALLRAFYGLLALWVINGFFGLLRAAGPGAAIIYIELGLLIGYWIWVFYWWRTNRPKASRSAAKKPRARQTRETVDAEVRKAVDLEEAVARERNRRRKAQLQRTAGKVGSQVGSGINQLRYVLVGLIVVTIGIFGFQAYETNRQQEELRIQRQKFRLQTSEAMSMWIYRNQCVVTGWKQGWQAWYEENPETQTVRIYTDIDSPVFGFTEVTRTLPLPESIDQIREWGTLSPSNGAKINWYVSQQHFEGFAIKIQKECELKYPPPEGLSESEVSEYSLASRMDAAGLLPPILSPAEKFEVTRGFVWQDPFELLAP